MQLHESRAKLDEDREWLDHLERTLEQDQVHPHGGGARGRDRDVYRQIIEDGEPKHLINCFP